MSLEIWPQIDHLIVAGFPRDHFAERILNEGDPFIQ